MFIELPSRTERVEKLHQSFKFSQSQEYPMAIRYKEFSAKNEEGLKRRLGIFGEVHFANVHESLLARTVIDTYDYFAVEGATKTPFSLMLVSLAFIPASLAFISGNRRTHPSASSLLDKHPYPSYSHSLGDCDAELWSFSQLCSFAITGLYQSVISPYMYWSYKKHSDPYIPGTQAYEELMQEKKNGKKSLMSKISEHGINANFPQREQRMAEHTAEIFQQKKPGDLLVVVGKAHLDGVVENLGKQLSLTEKFSYP